MTKWVNHCHFGDVRDVLRRMIAEGVKVNTIITSPPYWGLRSYLPDDHPNKPSEIGSEPTFAEFLSTMVEVFNLARQVLADDGTAWVNMGDSYAGSRGGGAPSASSTLCGNGHMGGGPKIRSLTVSRRRDDALIPRSDVRVPGLKPKDLVGQPWRLAFALQDAGWWLRQDIVWHKPNPMPESTRDRATKAHEYMFLLAKSERYYFDFEAWKEPVNGGAHARLPGNKRHSAAELYSAGDEKHRTKAGLVAFAERKRAQYKTPDGWDTSKGDGGHGSFHKGGREKGRKLAEPGSGTKNNASFDDAMAVMPDERNRRSVWTIPTEPFSGAHFATFPQKLIEPCVLAGCPVGGTVLDIFFGSGTTGQVAQRLGRNWIGIDLNAANEPLQRGRLAQPGLMLEVV